MSSPNTVIIGAGPAGLAAAGALKAKGAEPILLEKADNVGSVWRRHYDRLHLHTDRAHSGLPGLPMPASYPRYPSRQQFVDYLEDYARKFALTPLFGVRVSAVRREAGRWRVEAGEKVWRAANVVVATGSADFPYAPTWPGQETFQGQILHSSGYKNPTPFGRQRVLVVGFGNSGGEIALDLAQAAIDVTLAVRGPVRVLPRDLLGLPILTWAIGQSFLPARVSDALNAPVIRLALGSLEALGLRTAAKGPRQMVEEDGRVPLLDMGTIAKIRAGAIKVRGAIDRFTPDGIVFADGTAERYDAVILATGFHPDLRALLPDAADTLDAAGQPRVSGRSAAAPGLFFCGAKVVATGQLREIGIEAERIAELATRRA